MNTWKLLSVVVVGVSAGALVSIFFAPDKGSKPAKRFAGNGMI